MAQPIHRLRGHLDKANWAKIALQTMADGSTPQKSSMAVKTTQIGASTAYNISVSIEDHADAPMLLDLSALSKAGEFTSMRAKASWSSTRTRTH